MTESEMVCIKIPSELREQFKSYKDYNRQTWYEIIEKFKQGFLLYEEFKQACKDDEEMMKLFKHHYSRYRKFYEDIYLNY